MRVIASLFCKVQVCGIPRAEHVSRQPRVALAVDGDMGSRSNLTITPKAARDLARALLRAADEAEDGTE